MLDMKNLTMKETSKGYLVGALLFLSISLLGQESPSQDFADRQAILQTIEDFYIGDHTGSIKHKKSSMHKDGAYRYVDKNGKYNESQFQLDSDSADPNYKEELLSIEIYDKVALARLRLDQFRSDLPEYKLMTLHKTSEGWKITSIAWGFGIVH